MTTPAHSPKSKLDPKHFDSRDFHGGPDLSDPAVAKALKTALEKYGIVTDGGTPELREELQKQLEKLDEMLSSAKYIVEQCETVKEIWKKNENIFNRQLQRSGSELQEGYLSALRAAAGSVTALATLARRSRGLKAQAAKLESTIPFIIKAQDEADELAGSYTVAASSYRKGLESVAQSRVTALATRWSDAKKQIDIAHKNAIKAQEAYAGNRTGESVKNLRVAAENFDREVSAGNSHAEIIASVSLLVSAHKALPGIAPAPTDDLTEAPHRIKEFRRLATLFLEEATAAKALPAATLATTPSRSAPAQEKPSAPARKTAQGSYPSGKPPSRLAASSGSPSASTSTRKKTATPPPKRTQASPGEAPNLASGTSDATEQKARGETQGKLASDGNRPASAGSNQTKSRFEQPIKGMPRGLREGLLRLDRWRRRRKHNG